MSRMDRHRKKRRSKAWIPVLVVAIVIFGGGYFAWSSYSSSLAPMDQNNKNDVQVKVAEGASTGEIAADLKSAGLIRNVNFFKLYSKMQKNDGKYKAGVYTLDRSMSVQQLMTEIQKGGRPLTGAQTTTFTIPEGFNTKQIVARLVKDGLTTKKEFMNEVRNGVFDYKFLQGAPNDDTRLEGFLYPDTYEVYTDSTAHEIIDKMLARFDELFKAKYYTRAKDMGYSVRQIVVMGSIIEREAAVAKDRPIMAGVFYNRLKIGMKLQSCATIQYILGTPKEFLTDADLKLESPYNTYLHAGLPPGPICSPRIASIQAALYPDKNNYLYFVVSEKLDGSHNFSADYNQFLKDKAAYYAAVKSQGG